MSEPEALGALATLISSGGIGVALLWYGHKLSVRGMGIWKEVAFARMAEEAKRRTDEIAENAAERAERAIERAAERAERMESLRALTLAYVEGDKASALRHYETRMQIEHSAKETRHSVKGAIDGLTGPLQASQIEIQAALSSSLLLMGVIKGEVRAIDCPRREITEDLEPRDPT